MENLEKQAKEFELCRVLDSNQNKVKRLVIEHSARLKQENSAIENNLKQQLDHSVTLSNFKLYSN